MNTRKLFAIVFLLAALSSIGSAQENRKYFSSKSSYITVDIHCAQERFARCLESENYGVVESAMAHLVKMKLFIPVMRNPKIEQKLEMLSMNGPTPSIRFKAYIAMMVFVDPALFASERDAEFNDGDELFAALAHRLQQSIVSLNGR